MWLVENNIFYRDVTIDTAVLTQLPVDGDYQLSYPLSIFIYYHQVMMMNEFNIDLNSKV